MSRKKRMVPGVPQTRGPEGKQCSSLVSKRGVGGAARGEQRKSLWVVVGLRCRRLSDVARR